MDPVTLFKECLKLENLEGICESYYRRDFDEYLVISKDPEKPNIKQKCNDEINSILEKYSSSNENQKNEAINSIIKILKRSDSKYFDLSASFPLFDMNNGLFKKIDKDKQVKFLSDFIPEYLEKRFNIYKKYKFSPVTMQLKKDFGAHKTTKKMTNNKIEDILKKKYSKAINEKFKFEKNQFFLFDETHDQIVEKINKEIPIKKFSRWKKDGVLKTPDVGIIDNNLNVYICEMKHVKEPRGGGQDKQFNELVAFIKRDEDQHQKMHLVSFLDGYAFNSLNNENIKRKEKILEILKSNKNLNYYVNTYGFRKLFFC